MVFTLDQVKIAGRQVFKQPFGQKRLRPSVGTGDAGVLEAVGIAQANKIIGFVNADGNGQRMTV